MSATVIRRALGLWLVALAAAMAATVVVIGVPSGQRTGSEHFLEGLGGIAASSGRAPLGQGWATVVDILVIGTLLSSLVVARALRRPEALRGQSLDSARNQVRAILADHGEDSLSPYVLRPDKEFEIVGDGFVAFTVISDTVIVSGDPVGSPACASQALTQLLDRAHRAGLKVGVYGASANHLATYRQLGMHAVCTGEEAVVDPRGFSLEGRGVRKLRQSANRLERRGWHVTLHEGREIDAALEDELSAVESRWRARQRRILGFAMSMGAHEPMIAPDDLYVLARSPEGQLGGVMRLIAHRGKLSLDVMRRVGETPNGLNEALLCAALTRARETGIAEVSLNYAGLGHLLRPGTDRRLLRGALASPALARLRGHFQLERLIVFNEKFSPQWRPRYLVVDSRSALPRTLWRVFQAEGHLPRATPRGKLIAAAGLGSSRTATDRLSR